jgi:hypothetical protein
VQNEDQTPSEPCAISLSAGLLIAYIGPLQPTSLVAGASS